MTKSQLLLLLSAVLFTANSHALSPRAIEGKNLYPTCHVCHNPEMDPPLAPPMWSVQRRYKRSSLNSEDFVQRIMNFVKAPSLEKAIQYQAVKQLGLMPPLPLPNEMLEKIATYILEEQFPPPCAHWAIGVKQANTKGDTEHAKKDQRKLDRFCNQQ